MKISPFVATFPHLDLIPSPDSFFSSIKSQYSHYRSSGFFLKNQKAAMYIQEIETAFGTHHGIIVNNELSDFKKGKILEHEKTLNAKEQTMMNFLMKSRAMVKPVLLSYPEVDEITCFIEDYIVNNKPVQKVKFEHNETHRFWEISNENQIKKLQKLFQKHVIKSYIADGHHRCATVLKLAENEHLHEEGVFLDSLLTAYYSFNNLKIYDYNRIVDIQGEISPIQLLARLSKYCKIQPFKGDKKPIENHTFYLFIGDEWFKLKWKKSLLNLHVNDELVLDSSLINLYVFNKILNIEDVRTDPRITYSEGVKSLEEVVKQLKKDKHKIGFFLPPLSIEEIVLAAEHQISMPPKTTWFEPRIKSGLIIKEF